MEHPRLVGSGIRPAVFDIEQDRVVITRSDQPVCRVPLSEIMAFAASYLCLKYPSPSSDHMKSISRSQFLTRSDDSAERISAGRVSPPIG